MYPDNRVAIPMRNRNHQKTTGSSPLVAIALLALSVAAAVPALASGDHGGEHHHDESGGHGHEDQGHGHGDEGHHHGDEGDHSFSFGAPADEHDADRTITVTARDTMKYEPDSVSIDEGTTVRFVVENAGQLQHSFTLATPAQQREHEKEMQGMPADQLAGHMAEDPNGIVVQPGETGSITWRFTKARTVQFACHIPGHYQAGMKGSIHVSH